VALRRSDEDLDEILTWNLVRAARLTARRLSDRLDEHDLNPVTFGILAHLAVTSPMTQADLARAVLIRPQSIAALLDGLEQRGLICRAVDRSRGRRNPVVLTDDGHQMLETVWDTVIETNDLSDDGLSPEETNQLNRLLLKLVHAGNRRARSAVQQK
jgi:DNA-binding MarR family transcriptional regulator